MPSHMNLIKRLDAFLAGNNIPEHVYVGPNIYTDPLP
jgi:hypothetical protein